MIMICDTCFTRVCGLIQPLARWAEKRAPFCSTYTYSWNCRDAHTFLELSYLFICLSKFTLSCVYVVLSCVFFARISSTHTQRSLSPSKIWEKMLATKALISKWWVHFGALSWHAEETTCWLFCHLSQKICRYALVITDYALWLLKSGT